MLKSEGQSVIFFILQWLPTTLLFVLKVAISKVIASLLLSLGMSKISCCRTKITATKQYESSLSNASTLLQRMMKKIAADR